MERVVAARARRRSLSEAAPPAGSRRRVGLDKREQHCVSGKVGVVVK